jgi:hypothetical protein
MKHQALHGNAFNPDTGKIAECRKLARSSEGHLWQLSNAKEIGRLAQELGPDHPDIKGTNTICFIAKFQLQKGRKATYLRVTMERRI